jgi:hypothetical protein
VPHLGQRTLAVALFADSNMNPDYTSQLERLINVLSHKDSVPTWVISIVGVVIGAALTLLFGIWKERHEAKRRKKRLERAICGELLLNHQSLFGALATDFDFNHIKPTQTPFGGMFTFDALENAKNHGDILYEIPHFAVMRSLYKMYQMMSELHGGGPHTEALARDGVRNFETLFSQGDLVQRILIKLSDTCAPALKSRLVALAKGEVKPGK